NYDLSSTSVMRIKLPVSQAVTVVISDAVGKIVSADPNIADAQPITDNSLQKVLDIVGQYGSPAVVNTMTFVGGQQVNLEVRILEAQRDAGRELGISWGAHAGGSAFSVSGGPSNPAGDATSFSSFMTSVISGVTGLS